MIKVFIAVYAPGADGSFFQERDIFFRRGTFFSGDGLFFQERDIFFRRRPFFCSRLFFFAATLK
jgi:hypothetical protein